MARSSAFECGAKEQTGEHVVLYCPIHQPPHIVHDLTNLDAATIELMFNICPESSGPTQWSATAAL